MQNVLVLSIAMNGYQWLYRTSLASHRRYAQKHGFHHCLVAHPYISSLGVECCWLKLTLMRAALRSGYDWVLFVDADALIQPRCPDFRCVEKAGGLVYMAKGYTGRFNSGVMMLKRHPKVLHWLDNILDSQASPVAPEHDVGWGENGHVIAASVGQTMVRALPPTWNNTREPMLRDFIRHSNHGPLRPQRWRRLVHKLISRTCLAWARCQGRQRMFCAERLFRETDLILARYPILTRHLRTGFHNASQNAKTDWCAHRENMNNHLKSNS